MLAIYADIKVKVINKIETLKILWKNKPELRLMFEAKLLGSRYLLVQQLGQGSFGKTYLANDIMLPGNPQCVVKKLNPIFKDRKSLDIARRLFETEAKALQKLGDRTRIPQLLAYFEEREEFYLVQQYIEGPSLSQELIPGKPWSEARVIKLLENCLDILDYIHSQGIIHRDVKPENIIRHKTDNKLVLVDFGAVKEVILAQTNLLLDATVAIGTRGYMPQEQAIGQPHFNSDIYALGVIAIQALTGFTLMKLQEDQQSQLIWHQQVEVNPDLARILVKMTRSNFKKRYQSAREVIEAISCLTNNSSNIFKQNSLHNFDVANISTLIAENYSPSNQLSNDDLEEISSAVRADSDVFTEKFQQASSQTNKNNSSFDPEFIEFCQQKLANYIGPLSSLIVKDILRKNPQINLPQLIERLAAEIPNSEEAREFTTIIEQKSPSTIVEQNNSYLSLQFIEFCQQELANYIGPLSNSIVKDILRKNPQINLSQLIERLAAEIPNFNDAKEFKTIVSQVLLSKIEQKNSSLTPESIEFCQQELANYIGPLSHSIVKDILRKNPQINFSQLVKKLAVEIPDSRKAREFKKNLLSRF